MCLCSFRVSELVGNGMAADQDSRQEQAEDRLELENRGHIKADPIGFS